MPRASHYGPAGQQQPKRHLLPIYAASLLLIFHAFVVAYINSSFLQQFIREEAVGTIYTIGSALSVFIFLFVSRVLHKVGNFKLSLFLLVTNFAAVLGMAFATELKVAVPLFLLHLITVPLIIFNLDVFIDEGHLTRRYIGADSHAASPTSRPSPEVRPC